jgi:glutamate synthase domain-containing protein 2
MLIAGGCITCMQCSVGSCVGGLATQKADHVDRYAAEHRALQMHHYLESIRWQMASIIHALGYNDVRQLSLQDLVALTPEAAAMTRLPYEPGYRDQIRKQLEQEGALQP